jgi:hypothetical protein
MELETGIWLRVRYNVLFLCVQVNVLLEHCHYLHLDVHGAVRLTLLEHMLCTSSYSFIISYSAMRSVHLSSKILFILPV